MPLIVLLFVVLFSSATFTQETFTQETDGRTIISKKIMKIYQEHCQISSEKTKKMSKIKSIFELAAVYIVHGQYNDMKEQMLKAKSISKNADCRKSINDFLN